MFNNEFITYLLEYMILLFCLLSLLGVSLMFFCVRVPVKREQKLVLLLDFSLAYCQFERGHVFYRMKLDYETIMQRGFFRT